MVRGMPGWAPANSRRNSPTVSAGMDVRGCTLKRARGVAFNAASTFEALPPTGGCDTETLKAPDEAHKRGEDNMGRPQKANEALAGCGVGQPGVAVVGLSRF